MGDDATLDKVSQLSLLSPEFHDRMHEFYAWVHQNCPVFKEPQTGIYIVSKFDDVRSVLLDPQTFSSQIGQHGVMGPEAWRSYQAWLASNGWRRVDALQSADPPAHGRTRRILDRVFNTRRLESLEGHIAQTVHEVIDGFIDRGECEFLRDFAIPFPGLIISEQFGFDRKDLATFRNWSKSFATAAGRMSDQGELQRTAEMEVQMQHFLNDMMEQRRRTPKDDLLSRLAQEVEAESGVGLSMEEIQAVMRQVITGGYGTLTGAFTNGMLCLVQNAGQMEKLRADRSLLTRAIEEMIRIDAPNQGLLRTTTRKVELSGVPIPKEATVMVRWGAANHDPSRFSCPHVFDIERENAGAHISFGAGPHFCVGRVLARMELRIGFSALLDRLDDIELARPLATPAYEPSIVHHNLRELPLRFRKIC